MLADLLLHGFTLGFVDWITAVLCLHNCAITADGAEQQTRQPLRTSIGRCSGSRFNVACPLDVQLPVWGIRIHGFLIWVLAALVVGVITAQYVVVVPKKLMKALSKP